MDQNLTCGGKKQTDKSTARSITEKDGLHRAWYEDAKKVTPETLPEFVRQLTEDYAHDYGTICHACAAAAIAAAWAVSHSPHGGITGFQAGCIMWSFITHWMSYMDKPLRLLHMQDMLYPQMEYKFTTITQTTWEWLQKEAKTKLEKERADTSGMSSHPDVVAHWESIASGQVPFGYQIAKDK